MNCVHLLEDTHKRRRLAFAYVLLDFTHFSQPAAEVVSPVPKIEFGADIDHIPFVQLRHTTTSAGILNFSEAGFAGASGFGSREGTIGFGAAMFLRHDFHFWQSLTISAILAIPKSFPA